MLLDVSRLKKQLLITTSGFFSWIISNVIGTEKCSSPATSKCGIQPDQIMINFSYKTFPVFFIMCPSWHSALIRSIRLEKLPVSSNPDPIIADSYLIWPCWQLLTFCLKAVRFFSAMPLIRGYPRILLLQSSETFSEFPAYIYCQADVPRSALSYN